MRMRGTQREEGLDLVGLPQPPSSGHTKVRAGTQQVSPSLLLRLLLSSGGGRKVHHSSLLRSRWDGQGKGHMLGCYLLFAQYLPAGSNPPEDSPGHSSRLVCSVTQRG